jgi:hypothetical protein
MKDQFVAGSRLTGFPERRGRKQSDHFVVITNQDCVVGQICGLENAFTGRDDAVPDHKLKWDLGGNGNCVTELGAGEQRGHRYHDCRS